MLGESCSAAGSPVAMASVWATRVRPGLLVALSLVCVSIFLCTLPAGATSAPPRVPCPPGASCESAAAGASYAYPVPGLQTPNGLAVYPTAGRLFVTSRDNDNVIMLSTVTMSLLKQAPTGASPWGVTVNEARNKVYVGSFTGGDVRVFNATTLDPIKTIPVEFGAQLTFLAFNPLTERVFAVAHGSNSLIVINSVTDQVEMTRWTTGAGAWGLAANPALNRVYVGHRDSRDVVTFDGTNNWLPKSEQTIKPCGDTGSPYALGFNTSNNRLYVACAFSGNVTSLRIYEAAAGGLSYKAAVALPPGGANGGGGIAANTATGDVFVTNSSSASVTVVSKDNAVVATVPVGLDPFGAAADVVNNAIYVGNRTDNTITVIADTYAPNPNPPLLTLSRRDACQGITVAVHGEGFPYNPAQGLGHAAIYMDGAYLTTAGVRSDGTFDVSIVVPANAGGDRTIMAHELLLPGTRATATLRTPRTDVPVILIHGAGGGELVSGSAQNYWAVPDPNLCKLFALPDCMDTKRYDYGAGELIWASPNAVLHVFGGQPRYLDILLLAPDGQSPQPDAYGHLPDVRVGGLLHDVMGVVDVYGKMLDYLHGQGYVDGVNLFTFAYDWRKDATSTDAALDARIGDALRASGKDKVAIVAHSMGGLVTRNYLLRHGTARVDQVITMGTPYLGSPMAAKYLEIGDDMGMGLHLGDLGIGMPPPEVKKMSQNFGGVYDLIPPQGWYTPSPYDVSYDPRYLLRSRIDGLTITLEPLSYSASDAFLTSRHNAGLMQTAKAFHAQGVGDMSQLTGQYFAQRIAGTNLATLGHLYYTPRQVCATICFFGCRTFCVNLPEATIPRMDAEGDNTVPMRSAIGGNLPAGDERYYFVSKVTHMNLPGDPKVQSLVGKMLRGELCSSSQPLLAASGAGEPGAQAVTQAEADLRTEVLVIGTADLNLTDSAGRHTGPIAGQAFGSENKIPGVSYMASEGAQVAVISEGGPYTITLASRQAAGAAMLRITPQIDGAMLGTVMYPGIPMTATTVATLTLAGPGVLPGELRYVYQPGLPPQTVSGRALNPTEAGDLVPPAGQVHIDPRTHLVTIEAQDNPGGSGIEKILYSTGQPPVDYSEYGGPFTLPAGDSQVTAVITDRAGNSGTAGPATLTWLPLLLRPS